MGKRKKKDKPEDLTTYQSDSEIKNSSFAIHKQNAVFIPRV